MKTTTVIYLPQEVLIVENDWILSIPFIDIMTINCDNPNILVETTSKKYHLSQNLSGFCEGLPPFIMQCNKSTYINLLQVATIQKSSCGYEVIIKGVFYPIARRRVAEIKENFLKFKTGFSNSGNCNNCKVAG